MEEGVNYLITTDDWFMGPNGKQYKAVWAPVEILQDNEILGIKTNARSSNWYAKVGYFNDHIIVAGCQIHYAARCNQEPKLENDNNWEFHQGQKIDFEIKNKVYITQNKNF